LTVTWRGPLTIGVPRMRRLISPDSMKRQDDTSLKVTVEFAAVERATPLGHWGGEQEIATAVLALIASDFITGETIRVDGGRHLS